ncbi:polysaccharide deacetylase family protein [Sphingomonas sp. RB3P16]|uniref:polysaccharide deacetylase family protein n=1 Tax=Parasphingomonas frigoris TaxID=3096163 RepID=UPI002FC7A1FF
MAPSRRAAQLYRFRVVLLSGAIVVLGVPTAFSVGRAPPWQASDKRIALTFDDVPRGPGAFYTPDQRAALLIAGLREAGVEQAAFFANPGRIGPANRADERLAAYVAAGHVVGDHTFSHRDLASMPAAAFLDDIDRAEGWLKGRAGYRPWFRFPGLNQGGRDVAKRRAVVDGLTARGLQIAWVSVDGSDWNIEGQAIAAKRAGLAIDYAALRDLYVETMVQSADFSDALMRRTIHRAPPQVLLLHETDIAARYLSALVAALRSDGWQIVTADAAFADPVYHDTSDFVSANGTLPEALAWRAGLAGRLDYERNGLPLANRLFAERVLHRVPSANVPALSRGCRVNLHPGRRVCPSTALVAPLHSPLGIAA